MASFWTIDADNVVILNKVRISNDTFMNSGTVTAVIEDVNGTALSGSGTINFQYVTATNGTWRGDISSVIATNFTENKVYIMTISLNDGGSRDATFKIRRPARFLTS